jgi:hypothetical protein
MNPFNNTNHNRHDERLNSLKIPTRLNNLIRRPSSSSPTKTFVLNHQKRKSLPPGYSPTEMDVCCGRGKCNWNHPGNIKFRNLIQSSVELYTLAPTKSKKTAVVVSLVDGIRAQGGCFLKQNSSGNWFDIGDQQARDKVGHSLRDQANSQARQKNKHEAIKKVFQKKTATPPAILDNSDSLSDSGRDREIRRATLSSSRIVDAFSRRPSLRSATSRSGTMVLPTVTNHQNSTSLLYLEFLHGVYQMDDELRDCTSSY